MKRALTLTYAAKARNVWFVCLVAVAASLSGPAAFALDFMGPPRAGVDEGQFIFGVDLSYSETDLEFTSGRWTNPNVSPFAGGLPDRTVSLETTKLYATAGYGFTQNWEAFLGIAATKSEFGDDLWNSGEDFDGGTGLGVRGGVKTTFLEYPDYDLQFGGLIQFDWANYDGKLEGPVQAGPDFVEIDLWEMQIAVGATYWWKEKVKVYAGPFVYYLNGDPEQLDVTGFENNWDIDDGPNWGFYLGALVDLTEVTENCVFNIEYQYSSDAYVIGAGLMLTY
ncbi:MAG: hypothetical protein ACYSWQ_25190 [Planctomycetota bacterium]|jgi:hypothetical protein